MTLSLSISLCIKYNQSGTHVCTNYVLPLLELPPYRGDPGMILGAELSEALIYWYDKQVSGDEPD